MVNGQGIQQLPLPVRVPKRFDENNARRGVGSCGLHVVSACLLGENNNMCSFSLPLVNVEVLRQISGKASRRRRAANGFQAEVVDGYFVHAQVFEVEIAGTKSELASTMSSEHVLSLIPAAPLTHGKGGRLHGSQWRRMFHYECFISLCKSPTSNCVMIDFAFYPGQKFFLS